MQYILYWLMFLPKAESTVKLIHVKIRCEIWAHVCGFSTYEVTSRVKSVLLVKVIAWPQSVICTITEEHRFGYACLRHKCNNLTFTLLWIKAHVTVIIARHFVNFFCSSASSVMIFKSLSSSDWATRCLLDSEQYIFAFVHRFKDMMCVGVCCNDIMLDHRDLCF